jgi:hypothetical protein
VIGLGIFMYISFTFDLQIIATVELPNNILSLP